MDLYSMDAINTVMDDVDALAMTYGMDLDTDANPVLDDDIQTESGEAS